MGKFSDSTLSNSRNLEPPFTITWKYSGEEEQQRTYSCLSRCYDEVAAIRRTSSYDNMPRITIEDSTGRQLVV